MCVVDALFNVVLYENASDILHRALFGPNFWKPHWILGVRWSSGTHPARNKCVWSGVCRRQHAVVLLQQVCKYFQETVVCEHFEGSWIWLNSYWIDLRLPIVHHLTWPTEPDEGCNIPVQTLLIKNSIVYGQSNMRVHNILGGGGGGVVSRNYSLRQISMKIEAAACTYFRRGAV